MFSEVIGKESHTRRLRAQGAAPTFAGISQGYTGAIPDGFWKAVPHTDDMSPTDVPPPPPEPSAGQSGASPPEAGPEPFPPAGDTTTMASPTRPTSAGPAKRLYRAPVGERALGGVAKGIADYFGVATGLVRFGFILLSFVGGLGLLLYLGALLAVPERPPHVPPGAASSNLKLDSVPAFIGGALILIAVAILLNDVWFWSASVFWAMVLILVGVLLFRRADENRHQESVADAAGFASQPQVAGYRGPGGAAPQWAPDATAPPPRVPWAPPPPSPRKQRKPRERSALGRITVAVALVLSGALIWLDQANAIQLSGVQIGASALGVIGLGLLVGTIFGRARWLAIIALLLAPPLALTAALDLPLDISTGQRRVAPQSVDGIATDYNLGVGELWLDLRDVPFNGETVEIDVSLGIGELRVTMPDDVAVDVDAQLGAGEYILLGRRGEGTSLEERATQEGANGQIMLDANLGLGSLQVETEGDTVDRLRSRPLAQGRTSIVIPEEPAAQKELQ